MTKEVNEYFSNLPWKYFLKLPLRKWRFDMLFLDNIVTIMSGQRFRQPSLSLASLVRPFPIWLRWAIFSKLWLPDTGYYNAVLMWYSEWDRMQERISLPRLYRKNTSRILFFFFFELEYFHWVLFLILSVPCCHRLSLGIEFHLT